MNAVSPAYSETLDGPSARDLTNRIKAAADQLWRLLLEAHERRAWHVLGYRTWEDYVRVEFDMSRSRSYQLLDQGRVIKALEAVVSTTVDISEREARDLKPALAEAISKVTEGVSADPVRDPRDVVRDVVDRLREPDDREAALEELWPRHKRSLTSVQQTAAVVLGQASTVDVRIWTANQVAGMTPAARQEIRSTLTAAIACTRANLKAFTALAKVLDEAIAGERGSALGGAP